MDADLMQLKAYISLARSSFNSVFSSLYSAQQAVAK